MASPKFFKKFYPAVPIRLGNNVNIQFSESGILGYFSTTDDYVQSEFARLMREQRGGITEITAEEFQTEYTEKKTQSPTSAPHWREELSKSTPGMRTRDPVERLGGEYVQRAVAVGSESDIRKNKPSQLAPVSTAMATPLNGTTMAAPEDSPPELPKTFTPTVGRRSPKK
jgi:hypothetical protein